MLLVFSQIIPFYSRRNKNKVDMEITSFAWFFLDFHPTTKCVAWSHNYLLWCKEQGCWMLMMIMIIVMMMIMVMIRQWALKNWRLSNAKYKPSDGWWRTNKIDNWNGINWDKIHHQLNRKMQKKSFYLKFFTTKGNKDI